MTKICSDCEHRVFHLMEYYCCRPTGKVDLVTGARELTGIICYTERSTGIILSRILNRCGKEGRFYEEKV